MKKTFFFLLALLFSATIFAQEVRETKTFSNPLQRAALVEQSIISNGNALPQDVISEPESGTRGGTVILSQNFESTTGTALPTGWTRSTTSGYYWRTGNSSTSWGGLTGVPGAEGSSRYVGIPYTTTANSGSWLWTPAMNLTAGTAYSISFYTILYGWDDPIEYESLRVSIGQTASDVGMTTTLWESTIEWMEDWTKITLTYTPTTSGNHYLGFFAFTPAGTGLFITVDNVLVSVPRNNDISAVAIHPYSQIPVSQPIFPTISAQAKNVGKLPQTNVKLNVSLNSAAIGTSTSVPTLNPDAVANLSVPTSGQTYLLGTNSMAYNVSQTETDEDPTDNTVTRTFTGTNNLFATDNGTIATYYYGVATAGYGNIYTFTKTTKLCQVQSYFYVDGTNNASTYGVEIYQVTGENTINPTPIFSQLGYPKSTTAAAWAYATLSTPINLPAGSYFVCVTGDYINILGDANTFGRHGYISSGSTLQSVDPALFVRVVVDLPDNNLTVSPTFPYTQIPATQTLPTTLTATVINNGLFTQNNIVLTVLHNGTPIGTSAPLSSLAMGASATMSVTTSSVPVVLGANSLTYTVTQTEVDDFPADNTVTRTYTGTDYLYAIEMPLLPIFRRIPMEIFIHFPNQLPYIGL